MNHRNPCVYSGSKSQVGAALIVSLILLLVLTILGVTAMNSSILQNFMAQNLQRQTLNLATAENLLLQGESEVEDLVLNGVQSKAGRLNYYFNLDEDPSAEFDPNATGAVWPDNNFVIEYMGDFLIPGESAAIGGGLEDSLIHIFRVSARETTADRGGERIVQSLYVTLVAPDE